MPKTHPKKKESKIKKFFKEVGHQISVGVKKIEKAIGTVYHDAMGIVQKTTSLPSQVLEKGSDTIKSLGSSLSMPLLAIGAIGGIYLLSKK